MDRLRKKKRTKWVSFKSSFLLCCTLLCSVSGFSQANFGNVSLVGLNKISDENLNGQGVTIAVFDAGFLGADQQAWYQRLENEGRILGKFNLVADTTVFAFSSHGTNVLSVIAGNENALVGSAPKANFLLFVTEDVASESRLEEFNWGKAAHIADSLGAAIINSSLTYTEFDNPTENYTHAQLDGYTATISQFAIQAARKGIFVVNSAGNYGNKPWEKIGFPADADSILTVGAVDSIGVISAFSSVGNTVDGRIKPEVLARGSKAYIYNANGELSQSNGTSFSGPIMAGFVARLMQAFPDTNIQTIRSAVIESANNFNKPNAVYGYGIPNFNKAFQILGGTIESGNVSSYIYPNPIVAGNAVNFNLTETTNYTAVLYSLVGQKLLEEVAISKNNRTPSFEIPRWITPGMYRFAVEIDGALVLQQLVQIHN